MKVSFNLHEIIVIREDLDHLCEELRRLKKRVSNIETGDI